jgi:hypothetical protein
VLTGQTPIKQDDYAGVSLGDGFAGRDYSPLGSSMQADFLLVIDVLGVGTARDYKGFMPNSPPAAYFDAVGQLIELKSRKLLWQRQVQLLRSAQAEWDQPPGYPRLTQKVHEAIDAGSSLLIADFAWHRK